MREVAATAAAAEHPRGSVLLFLKLPAARRWTRPTTSVWTPRRAAGARSLDRPPGSQLLASRCLRQRRGSARGSRNKVTSSGGGGSEAETLLLRVKGLLKYHDSELLHAVAGKEIWSTRIISFYILSFRIISNHIGLVWYRNISYCIVLYRIVLCCFVSYLSKLRRIVSFCILSHCIVSYSVVSHLSVSHCVIYLFWICFSEF